MLYLCYLCRFKPLRDHLRGFLIAAWAGDKIAEFSFPEISFHFPLRPWFFFVSPAYAGKSATSRPAAISRLGSPPHVRGKVTLHQFRQLACRDHPRMCGEKPTGNNAEAAAGGSPPHVRGKASRLEYTTRRCRITPACAGKRGQGIARDLTDRDHPRMCGEKVRGAWLRNWRMGSPPRMRGKVPTFHPPSGAVGITPAYAGKRRLCVVAAHLGRDHPRVCGEKAPFRYCITCSSGSPPRMRGKGLKSR